MKEVFIGNLNYQTDNVHKLICIRTWAADEVTNVLMHDTAH